MLLTIFKFLITPLIPLQSCSTFFAFSFSFASIVVMAMAAEERRV